MKSKSPNELGAVNGGIRFLFHAAHAWPAATDPERLVGRAAKRWISCSGQNGV
jgi:hypothetical protein